MNTKKLSVGRGGHSFLVLAMLPMLVGTTGCKFLFPPKADAGTVDAGESDAGVEDAGVEDAGIADAGSHDAGTPDSGAVDSGTLDSGMIDSGIPDSGEIDSGTPDSGEVDSGTPDSGPVDAGPTDAGTPDGGLLTACNPNPCDNGTCTLTPLAFECSCPVGSVFDGESCVASACASGQCGSNANCVTRDGAPVCLCDEGYAQSGGTCVSVGEIYAGGDPSSLAGLTCAIHTDQTMWCWGDGFQVLDPSAPDMTVPTQFGVAKWLHASVGDEGICAVGTDGSMWCEGQNLSATPTSWTQIGSGTTWTNVSVGQDTTAAGAFACGTQSDFSLWCWGTGTSGELGNGAASNSIGVPVEVAGGATWTTVKVGEAVSCGIQKTDHSLWCWGDPSFGHTGTNTGIGAATSDLTSPTRVGAGSDWQSLSAGAGGCAVKQDGELWCWGETVEVPGVVNPSAVPVEMSTARDWNRASARIETPGFCATDTGGALYCAGDDDYGEAGNGITTGAQVPLAQVGTATNWGGVINTRMSQSCAVDGSGAFWCWGDNRSGQLGNGESGGVQQSPVQAGVATDWTAIGPGLSDHICGIETGGKLSCWGLNDFGAIGDGTQADESGDSWRGEGGGSKAVPTPPDSALTWNAVTEGYDDFTCAIASDKSLWCWGENEIGQLGIGSKTVALVPTEVSGGGQWKAVSAGEAHTCGIQTDGTLWCWGSGDGTASAAIQTSPVQVGSATNWSVVSAGDLYTCGIAAGTLLCWGDAGSPLGVSGSNGFTAPTQIGSATDWQSLSSGAGTACGIESTGALSCWSGAAGPSSVTTLPATTAGFTNVSWGNYGVWATESDGTLWYTREFGSSTLSQLTGPGMWASVVSADNEACAVQTNGTLWCLGSNQSGELGNGAAWSTAPVQVEQ